MKKNNEFGFFLSETMVVMAIVAVVLLGVFKVFSSTYMGYKESELYDAPNALVVVSNLMKYYNTYEFNETSLLGDNYYIELTNNATFNSEYYTNLKSELNVDKIYLFDMEALFLGNNINAFDISFRKYLKKLQNQNYDYGIVAVLNSGEYAYMEIQKPDVPTLVGDPKNEYIDAVQLGEEFVDPGYINWDGDEPVITGLDELDTTTEGTYYLNYDFNGYMIRRKIVVDNLSYEYEYTGESKLFVAPVTGWYQIELWGAQGGTKGTYIGGKGGYTSGDIYLEKGEQLHVYVGGIGSSSLTSGSVYYNSGGYNGGGVGGNNSGAYSFGGGGATDVRYFGDNTPSDLSWNNVVGLRSRIMIAGGGGGAVNGQSIVIAGAGGGLQGIRGTASSGTYSGSSYITYGGTQITFGTIEKSSAKNGLYGMGIQNTVNGYGGGGGGGHYGGACGHGTGGGGGSSYISGHTGSIAVTDSATTTKRIGTNGAECVMGTTDKLCSEHYSNKVFKNTVVIDGTGYEWTNVVAATVGTRLMPNPVGAIYESGIGHSGNGYAKIKYLGSGGTKITNLVANSGFESTKDIWSAHNTIFTKTSDKKLNGNYSYALQTPSAGGHSDIFQTVQIKQNHVYYAKGSYMRNASLTDSGQYDIIGFSASREMDFADLNNTTLPNINEWYTFSSRQSGIETQTASYRTYTFSTNPLYIDNLLLVDLTETFGSGNEPDIDWCDENIRYFEGTKYMTFNN